MKRIIHLNCQLIMLLFKVMFEGPSSATPLFLFICKSLAIIFNSQCVEINEITVKLLKIMKHTFRNTTYSKGYKISLHHAISIISMASKMAEAD